MTIGAYVPRSCDAVVSAGRYVGERSPRRRALAQAVIVGSVFLLLASAEVGTAANPSQWVWPKSWAETQVRKHFPGTAAVCDPVGPRTVEAGYNAYAEFVCAVPLSSGADYLLVIKPRSRAAWTTLSIKKVSSLPSTRGAIAPAAGGASGAAYVRTGSTQRIIDKSLDGSRLTLQDGSAWLISPIGQYESVLWLVTDDVAILKGTDPTYPYQLVDARVGRAASARYLGR
jgi:hypothetical protein